jgi:hypothetical protein
MGTLITSNPIPVLVFLKNISTLKRWGKKVPEVSSESKED